jgi:hypothetical protein
LVFNNYCFYSLLVSLLFPAKLRNKSRRDANGAAFFDELPPVSDELAGWKNKKEEKPLAFHGKCVTLRSV